MGPQTLYARRIHGGHPVIIHYTEEGHRKALELVQPESSNIIFSSTRSLLKYVTGYNDPPPFDQYFKQGRYQDCWVGEPMISVLDLFVPILTPTDVQAPTIITTPDVTVGAPPGVGQAAQLATEIVIEHGPGPIGVDLVNRADEVMKILFAGYGDWIRKSKYDPQEVLQEVYKGMLIRNRGKCPWDAGKSSFGHYVHMVCGSVMSNYHRKQQKIRRYEQVGIKAWTPDGDLGYVDVASSDIPTEPTMDEQDRELLAAIKALEHHLTNTRRPEGVSLRLVKKLIPHLLRDSTQGQMIETLGVPRNRLKHSLQWLRQTAREWFN